MLKENESQLQPSLDEDMEVVSQLRTVPTTLQTIYLVKISTPMVTVRSVRLPVKHFSAICVPYGFTQALRVLVRNTIPLYLS